MRREVIVVAVVLLAPALGCQFQKTSEEKLHPAGETGGEPDAGGLDLPPPDINITPPMADAGLFEAETTTNCIEANPQTKVIPPTVLLLLDRSGSMLQDITGMMCTGGAGGSAGGTGGRGGRPPAGGGLGDCGASSKWTQMTTALKEILPVTEGTVQWGIKYFAEGDSNSCTVNDGAAVKPSLMNATAIAMSIDGTRPASATPTTAAMKSATSYLLGLNDESPKFILLATDGLPTCGSGGGGGGADDDNAIAAVKDAKAMGIPTFVIGIGTGTGGGDQTLTTMANEGGFPRSGTPAYYEVNSGSDLKDAFSKISGMVGVCYFSVNPVPKKVEDIMAVKGDGNPIPQDGTDGWTFVTMPNSAGIQLNGKACEDYKSGSIKSVVVDLPCIIP